MAEFIAPMGSVAEESVHRKSRSHIRRVHTKDAGFTEFAMLSFVRVHIGFSARDAKHHLWRCIATPFEKE